MEIIISSKDINKLKEVAAYAVSLGLKVEISNDMKQKLTADELLNLKIHE